MEYNFPDDLIHVSAVEMTFTPLVDVFWASA